MNVLAIDTSSSFLSLAVKKDGEVFSYHKQVAQNQASSIYTELTILLQKANLELCNCDFLAFGKGPGSFTGVRIAAACTQGFAKGCNLPVVPISNLQALAHQALSASSFFDENRKLVLSAIDARMTEVYAAWHIIENGRLVKSSREFLVKPEDLSFWQEQPKQNFVLIGNVDEYIEKMPLALRSKISHRITDFTNAITIAELAQEIFQKKGGKDPQNAQPVYLRPAVV